MLARQGMNPTGFAQVYTPYLVHFILGHEQIQHHLSADEGIESEVMGGWPLLKGRVDKAVRCAFVKLCKQSHNLYDDMRNKRHRNRTREWLKHTLRVRALGEAVVPFVRVHCYVAKTHSEIGKGTDCK